ncbi:MAG: aminotransferase class I/II-fold pyridoxal phosphate-dependent enzyme, partial [Pseudomonadota bacterium]
KFWGLAGLRVGFAIGDPSLIARLQERMGPWPVSGPALAIATAALADPGWAAQQRNRLAEGAQRLDALIGRHTKIVGGTSLFRLYDVDDAERWQARLAEQRIWSRTFPYDPRWLRLGIPPEDAWPRLEALT